MSIKGYIQNLQVALMYDDKLSDMKVEHLRIIFEDMNDVYEETIRKKDTDLIKRLQQEGE